MEIISKNKNKDATTTYNFGDRKAMLEKGRKIATSTGYMIKPKINPNLKIREVTDLEKEMAKIRERYQKNGKTTWKGAAKLMIDVGKKMLERAMMQD